MPAILWTVIAALWVSAGATHAGTHRIVGRRRDVFRVRVLSAPVARARVRHARGVRRFGLLSEALYRALGPMPLLWLALGVFVVAWIGQFIGHKIEGRKPSFLTDLAYLLIGPAWIVAKLMRRVGVAY